MKVYSAGSPKASIFVFVTENYESDFVLIERVFRKEAA